MASKPAPPAKPATPPRGSDLAPYPMMHPYPGFTACTSCGGLLAWDRQAEAWVSAVAGVEHDCATRLIQHAAHWQHTVRLAEPRRFPSPRRTEYGNDRDEY